MDTEVFFVVVLGILAILVVSGFLRYRSKGETKFSIRDLVTFSFRGSNAAEGEKSARQESDVLLNESSVVAEEFVGRDKITNVYNSPDPKQESQLPELVLKLVSRDGVYQDEIVVDQPQPKGVTQDHDFRFGLALQNTAEMSIPAQGIDIRVEISWRGSELKSAPEFSTDIHQRTTPGWRTLRSKVRQKGEQPLPAILEFKGSVQDRCAFGHPLEWKRFRGHLFRRVDGCFLLQYRISSTSPYTASSGELKIHLR
jgi:hypothetical protein